MLEIDWQGAEQVRKIFPESTSIFILPPSKEALRERLSKRGQDSEAVIEKRLAGSLQEMNQYINFDYIVVNDDFNTALQELTAIVLAQNLTINQQIARQHHLLEKLFS